MKFDRRKYGEGYLFESTGRWAYANCGLVGISPDLAIAEGYDGCFSGPEFTREEKLELAEYMINLWRKYGGVK